MIPNIVLRTPDADRKCCADCCHLKAAVSWWCMNDDAVAYRGTKIPGVHNCQFWEPAEQEKPKKKQWWRFWA